MNEKKDPVISDLDHDQDLTNDLQKSEHPDFDYMKSHNLCPRCHGPVRVCDRSDCPNK